MTITHRLHSPRFDDRTAGRYREVRCPQCGIVKPLGRDRVVSAHRTSEGVVTYLRCYCGGLVVATPAGPTVHARPRAELDGA